MIAAVSIIAVTGPHEFPRSVFCPLTTVAMTARTQGLLGTTVLGKLAPTLQAHTSWPERLRILPEKPSADRRPLSPGTSKDCPSPSRRASALATRRPGRPFAAASCSGKCSFVLWTPLYLRSTQSAGLSSSRHFVCAS